MMDSAPFSTGSHEHSGRPCMHEFEPTPEYLNAISGPVPLMEEEVEDVSGSEDDYKQAMEQNVSVTDTPYKSLQIDELAGVPVTATNAISVTKLSPDLDAMTLKELQAMAKQKGIKLETGTRRKAIIEMLKGSDNSTNAVQGTLLSEFTGPEPVGGSSLE